MRTHFRKALSACVLVLTFTCSLSAEGIMHTDRTPAPTPSPTPTEVIQALSNNGEIYTDGAVDIVTEILLDLLQNLLVLF